MQMGPVVDRYGKDKQMGFCSRQIREHRDIACVRAGVLDRQTDRQGFRWTMVGQAGRCAAICCARPPHAQS
jgi:hypothetical protein